MGRTLKYLMKIHEAVLAGVGTCLPDHMKLTRKNVAASGLPLQAVNPQSARTVAANLLVSDLSDLRSGQVA